MTDETDTLDRAAELDLDALEKVARANPGILDRRDFEAVEYLATFDPPTVLALIATLRAVTAERDAMRELVPTPLNVWAAKGYQVDYSRDGPGATPRWCLHLNGVGSWPIAWFYRKADAQHCIDTQAQTAALRTTVEELVGALRTLNGMWEGDDWIIRQDEMASIAFAALHPLSLSKEV